MVYFGDDFLLEEEVLHRVSLAKYESPQGRTSYVKYKIVECDMIESLSSAIRFMKVVVVPDVVKGAWNLTILYFFCNPC